MATRKNQNQEPEPQEPTPEEVPQEEEENEEQRYQRWRAGRMKGIFQMLEKVPFMYLLPIDDKEERGRQAQRLLRMIMVTIDTSKNDALLHCSDFSLKIATMVCAELNLEPGSTGHIWLIPRKGVCNAEIGAYGMLELARRAGLQNVWAEDICANDVFSWKGGSTAPNITHEIDLRKWNNRGEVIGTYAFAVLDNGQTSGLFMPIEDINKARLVNQFGSGEPTSGPWKDWPGEMRKKTAIKRASKLWPKSRAMQTADRLESPEERDAYLAELSRKLDQHGLGEKQLSALDRVAAAALPAAPGKSSLSEDLEAVLKKSTAQTVPLETAPEGAKREGSNNA